MKKLKLVQDEFDIDNIHVYAPHGYRLLRVCTIHIDTLGDIFPEEIADHFQAAGAESLMINIEIKEMQHAN